MLGIYFYSGMGHTHDGSFEVFTTPPKTVANDGSFGQNDRSLPGKLVGSHVGRVLHHCSTFADNRVGETHCVKMHSEFSVSCSESENADLHVSVKLLKAAIVCTVCFLLSNESVLLL